MTNKNRGEVALKLRSQEFIMRPTFQAICSIEGELGQSIMSLLSKLDTHSLTLNEMSIIAKHGIKAAEQTCPNNIGDLLLEAGTINLLPSILEFLGHSIGLNTTL